MGLHQFVLLSQLLPMLQVVLQLQPQKLCQLEVKSFEVLGLHSVQLALLSTFPPLVLLFMISQKIPKHLLKKKKTEGSRQSP